MATLVQPHSGHSNEYVELTDDPQAQQESPEIVTESALDMEIMESKRNSDTHLLFLFLRAIAISVIISVLSSIHIGIQYIPLIFNKYAGSGQSGGYMFATFGLYALFFLNHEFVTRYLQLLFKMNGNPVKQYKAATKMCKGDMFSFAADYLVFFILLTYTIIVVVFGILFSKHLVKNTVSNPSSGPEDTLNDFFWELTSWKSPMFWICGLSLSPMFILFLVITFITVRIHRYGGWYKWNSTEHKRYLRKVVGAHFLLLMMWIFWKCTTTPKMSVHFEVDDDGTPHYNVDIQRNNIFLNFGILYFSTTAMKLICCKLVDIPEDNDLLNGNHLKRMIDILIQILFAFGLKFVFTNTNQWTKFIGLSVINSTLSILFNGSVQSHQYGKSAMNRMRETVNMLLYKCGTSTQLEIVDFNDLVNVKKYNAELAVGLTLKFVIESGSCLICMALFALNVLIGSTVNGLVFAFLAVSFGFDCAVFLGQIVMFKKRDREYFIAWFGDAGSKRDGVEFVALCLLLAWCWIGTLTGMPADISVSG